MPTQGIEPWMHGAFELIQEGIERLESGTDAGKRRGLVLFDEAIEQSIKVFATIPATLRAGPDLPPDRRKQAQGSLFEDKIQFLEWYLAESGQQLVTPIASIRWYHVLRNEIYHAGNGMVPELKHVADMKDAAVEVFGALFGHRAAHAARRGPPSISANLEPSVPAVRRQLDAPSQAPWGAPIHVPASPSRKWSSDDVIAALRGHVMPESLAAVQRLVAWTTEQGGSPGTGAGAQPSISAWMVIGGVWVSTWSCYAHSRTIAINFGTLIRKVPRKEVQQLAQDLRGIPGVAPYLVGLESSGFRKWPGLPLDAVVAPPGTVIAIEQALQRMIEALAT